MVRSFYYLTFSKLNIAYGVIIVSQFFFLNTISITLQTVKYILKCINDTQSPKILYSYSTNFNK